MPHLSGIEKAHRRRRIVERGQKIGFDVIDLCRGCPQAVQNVGNVHLCELPEPFLDDLDGDLLFSQPDGISGAALDFRDQLHPARPRPRRHTACRARHIRFDF